MHAMSLPPVSDRVVSFDEYRRACAARDAYKRKLDTALADVARLTAMLDEATPDVVTSRDLLIDMKTGIVTRGEREIATLTATERAIIRCLAARGNPMLSADVDLAVWGGDGGLDGFRRVRVNVHRIRQKIGGGYIRTVRGVGLVLR
jgi:DNA-binding response OmpR family regulator